MPMQPRFFQVPNAAAIRASEVMLHHLRHVCMVLCCDVVSPPQKTRKMGLLVD